jgi:hypothetical protein
MFRKIVFTAIALLGLTACTPTGGLLPPATNDVNAALAQACPVLAVLAGLKLSTAQNLAYNTLAIACPPNAPPTNAVTVALDLITAYNTLSPLIK